MWGLRGRYFLTEIEWTMARHVEASLMRRERTRLKRKHKPTNNKKQTKTKTKPQTKKQQQTQLTKRKTTFRSRSIKPGKCETYADETSPLSIQDHHQLCCSSRCSEIYLHHKRKYVTEWRWDREVSNGFKTGKRKKNSGSKESSNPS